MSSNFFVDEQNAYTVTFDLIDGVTGNAIEKTQLGTLICTLYYYNKDITTSDVNHLATINNRFHQNILDLNDFTISTTGNVTWNVQPEDTIKLDPGALELHVALITWQYSGKQNSHEILLHVRQLEYAEGE